MSALAEVITPEDVVIPSLLELFNPGELHCRPDIPNEVYHADRSCVSTSGLKQLPSWELLLLLTDQQQSLRLTVFGRGV